MDGLKVNRILQAVKPRPGRFISQKTTRGPSGPLVEWLAAVVRRQLLLGCDRRGLRGFAARLLGLHSGFLLAARSVAAAGRSTAALAARAASCIGGAAGTVAAAGLGLCGNLGANLGLAAFGSIGRVAAGGCPAALAGRAARGIGGAAGTIAATTISLCGNLHSLAARRLRRATGDLGPAATRLVTDILKVVESDGATGNCQ